MARKGQSFQKYTEELKREAVRLRLEERKSLREIREQLGVKSDAQIIEWVLTTKPLFHSDQGFQYTSKSYAKQLEKLGFVGSHSRRGNCFDNACIESFFSHLKTEKLYLVCPKTYEMAYRAIQEYIQFYNTERFQEKLHGLSPIEYREKAVA
nr:IS3 family transposase [Bacillus thuringiensis]